MNTAIWMCSLLLAFLALEIRLPRLKRLLYWMGVVAVLAGVSVIAYHYRQFLTLHMVFVYGYEIFGGILIFLSSAVTETLLPEGQRRNLWLLFGVLALVYAAFGIGIRHDDVRQSEQDRKELQTLKDNSTKLISTFNSVIPPLESDLTEIKGQLKNGTPANIDPKELEELKAKADSLQELVNTLKAATPQATMDSTVIQRDTMSLINRLEESVKNAFRDRKTWQQRSDSGITMPHIAQWHISSINREFSDAYQSEYQTDVARMYHELIRHIVNPPPVVAGPPRDYAYTHTDLPVPPEGAELKLYDLCVLLAEFEKENNLSITCSQGAIFRDLLSAREGK
jgi:hypothetical protein